MRTKLSDCKIWMGPFPDKIPYVKSRHELFKFDLLLHIEEHLIMRRFDIKPTVKLTAKWDVKLTVCGLYAFEIIKAMKAW